MEIEVVRHHGGAENTDRDVEHVRVARDLGLRNESAKDAEQIRLGEPQLHAEAAGDAYDQQHDEDFDVPESKLLQIEHEQHVQGRQAHAPHQRQMEQEIQGDGRADDLGEIARRNRELTEQPQHNRRRARVVIAACLGEVAAAGDAEPERERLQQDRHQVRQHDHAQQRVAVLRAAGEVGRPVAGVHVTDGDQVAGTGKRQHLAPETAAHRDRHRAMHLRQAHRRRRLAPSAAEHGAAGVIPGFAFGHTAHTLHDP